MSEQPQTEAGRALVIRRAHQNGVNLMDAGAMAVLAADVLAIEREAVAAYLASPEAVEEVARANHRLQNPDGGECSDLLGKHGPSAAAVLAALRDQRGAS